MARHPSAAVAIVLLGLAVPAAAQVPDLSGKWNLTTYADLPDDGGTCMFFGQVVLEQMGSSLSGTPLLQLFDGPAACPPIMAASLTGTVDEKGCVDGMLSSGPLGTSYFSGCPGDGMKSLGGDFGNETGPYAGGGGTWMAVMAPALAEIPTLDGLGLTLLAMLLVTAGGWALSRRAVI